MEGQIKQKQLEALKAKKAGQKQKALRLCQEINQLKKQVISLTDRNNMLLKQQGTLDQVKGNQNFADVMKHTNDAFQQAQKWQDQNFQQIEDAIYTQKEIEQRNEELNELIKGESEEINEEVEDLYEALEENELMDATEKYE